MYCVSSIHAHTSVLAVFSACSTIKTAVSNPNMDATPVSRLKELRGKKKELSEEKQKRYSDLQSFIKSRLGVFHYVLNIEPCNLGTVETAERDIVLVFNDRLDKIEKYCLEQSYSIFRTLMIPKMKIDAFLGKTKWGVEGVQQPETMNNLLKIAYSISLLREKIKNGRKESPIDNLHLRINIVSVACKFFNGKSDLCILDSINLEWPYSEEYSKVFENDFYLSFNVENMKDFIVNKKFLWVTKDLDEIFNLGLSDLKTLLSYRFVQKYGDNEILRHGEMEGKSPAEFARILLDKLYSKLNEPCYCVMLKALAFSYVVMKYRGLVKFVDTSYFKNSPAYYYVYWIDHLKTEYT